MQNKIEVLVPYREHLQQADYFDDLYVLFWEGKITWRAKLNKITAEDTRFACFPSHDWICPEYTQKPPRLALYATSLVRDL